MPDYTLDNWAAGIDNRRRPDLLRPGAVRNAVNVVARADGGLELRPGVAAIYTPAEAVRGALGFGGKVVALAGSALVEVDARTGDTRHLRTVAAHGGLSGAVFNDRLYFSTATETLVYDGHRVQQWGVQAVTSKLAVEEAAGQLERGWYKLAAVFVSPEGEEGGCVGPTYFLANTGGMAVTLPTPPAGHQVRLYVSAVDGSTLYERVTTGISTTVLITTVLADTPELETLGLVKPTPSNIVVAHRSQIALAAGSCLWLTRPMQPSLVDAREGFLQFPAPIGEVLSVGDTLFVSADKTYAISGLLTDGGRQTDVLDFPLVPGSGAKLPDGRVVAMTRYGLAVLGDNVDLPSAEMYAVSTREVGASVGVEHAGEQYVLTTMRGAETQNPLARGT